MPGDTDYSAANEYLARYATRLRAERPELDVLCVGWPAWDEVGLAADPTVKRRLERRGLRYLSPDEGVAWTAAVTGTSASLPAQVVVLPVPLPEPATSTMSARVDDVPAVDWWLIDSVIRHGSGATVLREYRTNDPRDVELVDHQIANRLRIAGVQILEQFLEAFLCLHPRPADSIELRDVTLHQGFVIGSQGRRQVSVHVTPPAADGVPPGDLAGVRLETRPVLAGGYPAPIPITIATGRITALGSRRPDPVDVAAAVPSPLLGSLFDRLGSELLQLRLSGRFAAEITYLSHPRYDAAARFRVPPRPQRRGRYMIDPPVLDLAIRSSAAVAPGTIEPGLPWGFERFAVYGALEGEDYYSFITVGPDGERFDIALTDPHGVVLAQIGGLSLKPPAEFSDRRRRRSPTPSEVRKL
jgi:hypothetical protein